MFAWTRDADPTQLARIVAPPLRYVQPVQSSSCPHRLALAVSSTKSVVLSAPYTTRTGPSRRTWTGFDDSSSSTPSQSLGAREVSSVEPPQSRHS
jgi:hypothetical protein